ncbi:MAG: hypothetical protein H7321_09315 [Bacteroidia bacterium]|nr:hypothetical protein [Bacteroidia bacterium]
MGANTKKFNFSAPLLDSKGKKISPEQSMSSTLSEMIGTETKGKTIKLYDWHKTLQVHKEIDLDESDRLDLVKIIEESDRLFIFVKGQLLEVLNKK